MKIYFKGEKCKLKAPCEIRLNNGLSLSQGDIIITSSSLGCKAYVVQDPKKEWERANLIAIVDGSRCKDWSNFLLYSFDGVDKRIGNIDALTLLAKQFVNTPIEPLLKASIEILTYTIDTIAADILLPLYLKLQPNTLSDSVRGRTPISSTSKEEGNERPFISYLPLESQRIARRMLEEGCPPKEVIRKLRSSKPSEFRIAFEKFVTQQPAVSIYKDFC